MRILCLHGSGASSTIMQSQIASLRALLPTNFEYTYLASPLPCPPAPEIQNVYPGPYSCFFTQYSTTEMDEAVEYLGEVMEEDGPFDAVIGFGQGAAVLAAYLASLSHSASSPTLLSQSPKLALLICAALVPPSTADPNTSLPHAIASFGSIPIPTIHIVGRKDPCLPQSLALAQTCEKEMTQVLANNEGHEVPKDKTALRSIAMAVERVLARGFVC